MSLHYKHRFERLKDRYNMRGLTVAHIPYGDLELAGKSFVTESDGLLLSVKQMTVITYQLLSPTTYTLYIAGGSTLESGNKLCSNTPLTTTVNKLLTELVGNEWSIERIAKDMFYLINKHNQSLPLHGARRVWNFAYKYKGHTEEVPTNRRPTRAIVPIAHSMIPISPRSRQGVFGVDPSVEAKFEPDRGFDIKELE